MTTYHKQIAATLEAVGHGRWPLDQCIRARCPYTNGAAGIRRPAAAVKGGAKVSIANFAFTPGEITIAPGETVTWTDDDGAPHGLEYNDGAKGVDLLLPGSSFTRRFDRPGTYEYNCSVHPYMTGRVVVRAQ